ncbi:TetR/AcrR family transcriptional regulator [Nocardia huaxiensis]|uniref:TetR/AcrR family transcriptional regulator n=1 Tax=Nocardia huaxiensis TaxID=2755382 RepID=A0A7D6ZI81_9NOCA|nr:TetR/AcrR family transcriptional regulator [Nocardia huaxiensis]QLY28543.1 TetR/AcrR family transcriptional regulator [Nocardia huaxiensis]UFS97992.1 TetR/AcrR family transcriptional regulator [Nocardia huaxiensis]
MGNREDLLAGARQAILERGLAKVTARDIANAAGVSLAAIGYHFGSKDRLVMETLTEGVGSDIGDGIEAAIRDAGEGQTPWDALANTWNGFVDVAYNNRESLILSAENGVQISRDPEAQIYMAEATAKALGDMAVTLREVYPELSAEQSQAVGRLLFILFQGLAMQSLIAPTAEQLSGEDLVTAVRALRGC